MLRSALSALCAMLLLSLVVACSDDENEQPPPNPYPPSVSYWRPISDPNLFMPQPQAQTKLDYDLAQCRCSNFPANYPHAESAQIAPDLGRLAETQATKVDTAAGGTGCNTTSEGVLLECMRARGWEPSQCGGRYDSPGGVSCALPQGDVPPLPESYPYRNPYDNSFGDNPSPAEEHQHIQ